MSRFARIGSEISLVCNESPALLVQDEKGTCAVAIPHDKRAAIPNRNFLIVFKNMCANITQKNRFCCAALLKNIIDNMCLQAYYKNFFVLLTKINCWKLNTQSISCVKILSIKTNIRI